MANGVGGDAEAGANGAVQILLAAPAHLDGHGLDLQLGLQQENRQGSTEPIGRACRLSIWRWSPS